MNRIQELRKARGLNQEDLAKILNVKRSAISKYESETIPLTADTIEILTDFFNVTSDYLLGRTSDPTPPNSKSPVYDDEALELMEEMHKRPELKVLFSTTKKASRSDIEAVDKLLRHMAGTDGDGDGDRDQ